MTRGGLRRGTLVNVLDRGPFYGVTAAFEYETDHGIVISIPPGAHDSYRTAARFETAPPPAITEASMDRYAQLAARLPIREASIGS